MLAQNDGNGMVMPVAPMNGGGYGMGNGLWGDGSFWIIVLFIFALMGNWGNGWGGNSGQGATNVINNDLQRGFDQQSVMNGLSALTSGQNTLAQSLCSGFAGVTAGMNAGFANAESAAAARQMANLQQQFAMQTAIDGRLDSMAMFNQQSVCENRAAVADLKYAMAQEGSATRANTDAKVQAVMDKLCQLELDGIKQNYENRIAGMQNEIDSLRSANADARFDASQANQTANIVRTLNPAPIPAYAVQNPYGCNCNNNWSGCNC